jgi:hypothetical protein
MLFAPAPTTYAVAAADIANIRAFLAANFPASGTVAP